MAVDDLDLKEVSAEVKIPTKELEAISAISTWARAPSVLSSESASSGRQVADLKTT